MTIDDLPFHDGHESPATANGATGARPCRRHQWAHVTFTPELAGPAQTWDQCNRCSVVRDADASRRGRTSLRAGKDAERAIVHRYAGITCAKCGEPFPSRRTGQYLGPDDAIVGGELFVVQSKAGGWFSERVWAELAKLPRSGGRIPTLVVSDRPGPGHRTRRYVVRTLDDDLDLHGPGAA
jgi:hypothetical protein